MRVRSLVLGALLTTGLGVLSGLAWPQGYGLHPSASGVDCASCVAGTPATPRSAAHTSGWGLSAAAKGLPSDGHASLRGADSRARSRDRDVGRDPDLED